MTAMSDYRDQDSISVSDCANVDGVTPSARATLNDPRISLEPEMAHAVASAFSRLLCETTSPLIRFASYTGHTLNRYVKTSVPGAAAPLPKARPGRPRDGAYALRLLGIKFDELQELWQQQVDADGVNATLPLDVLLGFFEAPFWRMAASLISDGPAVAVERMGRLLREEAKREVAPKRSRPDGGAPSQGHLDNYAKGGERLMGKLIELRLRGHESSRALAAWTEKARVQVPEAEDDVTDTTAPPLQLLRLAWAQLDGEIATVMRASLVEQLAVVPTLGARQQQRLFERLRHRAFYTLLFCLGARVDAIRRLTVGSYVPRRRLPDGTVGPAIALQPRKTEGKYETHYKPLPPEAAATIEVWLAFIELRLGRPQPANAPLFIPTLTRANEAWTTHAMRQFVGGNGAREGGYLQRAFLPKENEYHGYTPHTVRSAVTQNIRGDNAKEFLIEKGIQSDEVFRVLIGEALTDHSEMMFDRLGYGGAKKKKGRERLSGFGAHIMWELVTTDRGARRMLDEEGIRSALYKRLALEAELAKVRRAITEVFSGQAIDGDATARLLHAQRLNARKEQLDDELKVVEHELRELRENPDREVLVADDVDEVPEVDFKAIEREVLGGIAPHRRAALRPLRDPAWLTVAELAYVLDIGDATARRWADGKLPANPRKRPWPSAEEAPIDHTLGPKRRRIAVTGINPLLLDSELKRERLAETQARSPEGWTEEQAAAPLRIGMPASPTVEQSHRKRHLRAVA
jgi:hypothetical protein